MGDDGMDVDRPVKMEKDLSGVVDEQLPAILNLAKKNMMEALDQLQALEKQTRVAADLASSKRVLEAAVGMCVEGKCWKELNEHILLFAKKRGQLKQAIAKMVQEAMSKIDLTPDPETKLSLINTLIQVTEGKIFVEIEGARLVRMLAKIKEEEGKISEAADILQRLQVETFGSMERREKVDFILEQMRLLLAKSDYVRTQLVSKKINPKYFEKEDTSDLKLRYYQLMIQYAVHEKLFLDVCKYYFEIFKTESILASDEWKNVLKNIVIYSIMAPYSNEQSDLVNRVYLERKLEDVPLFKNFLKLFLTPELMRWGEVEARYKLETISVGCYGVKSPIRDQHWLILKERVIEHNIMVVSKCYSRIRLSRLSTLLSLSKDETEEQVSKLVVNKTIFARIDRPAQIINFTEKKGGSEILGEWAASTESLLSLIEKSIHLIAKEEMVNKITEVK